LSRRLGLHHRAVPHDTRSTLKRCLIVALKAKGVVFENYDLPGERSAHGAITAGGAKAAWFNDSEGNILALIEEIPVP
jgi:hypothetical protein